MTNEEFLDHVPWYQGIASAALTKDVRDDVRELGQGLFWLSPRYFAMMSLARQHPEEFAQLVAEKEAQACARYKAKDCARYKAKDCARYKAKDWALGEPLPEADVREALRAYVKQLEEESDGNSTVTSD